MVMTVWSHEMLVQSVLFFFFFQAEDGIRDLTVTGVQTCALPIFGGGFGVRFNIYPEYCALLLAAKRLGPPVQWGGTRSAAFTGHEQARDIVHRGEMALGASGRLLGVRFEPLCNLGAYLAVPGSFVNT